MSIYPVRLSEWFPPGDEMHDMAYLIVKISRCFACYKRPRWKSAVAMHALPWGYSDEVFCSWQCCKSGKVAKPDKRQSRKIKKIADKARESFLEVMKKT